MKLLIRLFASLVVPVFMLAVAYPAIAQDKGKDAKAPMAAKAEKGKVAQQVLLENDKVRAFEVRQKPGEENTSIVSTTYRVVRALKGGTIQRTYADGKIEKKEWKTGEVGMVGPSGAYTTKNIGKTELHLYIVLLKEPKK